MFPMLRAWASHSSMFALAHSTPRSFTAECHSASSSGVIFRLVPLVGSVTNGDSGDGDPAASVSLIAVKYIARPYGTEPSRTILT